jgi:hypothetical protein
MRPICKHCRIRPASRRAHFRYCWRCHTNFFSDDVKLARLPADHPFIKARKARVQQMVERARQRLPLFEPP